MAQLNFTKDGESMQAAAKTETILDSGERREAGTGSVRDVAKGKGRFDLVPLDIAGRLTDSRELAEIGLYMEDGDTAHIYSAITEFAISEHKDLYTILIELSIHYEAGCAKYGENNWRLGQPISWYISSGARHYNKHKRGDIDEPHDRAFVWNMVGIIWTHNNLPEMIDLPFKGGKSAAHADIGGPVYTCGDCRYIQTINASEETGGCEKYYLCISKRSHNGIVTPDTPACSVCEPCAWNTRAVTQTTREFVDRLVRHQRLLKAKHWARSGWDGVPPEEVDEYRATYAAFTKVIEYIKAWDERMNI